MNMDYTRSDLSKGAENQAKARETSNTFAMKDGISQPGRTVPLDRSSKNRMAGSMGVRALELMNNPDEQRRVGDFMAKLNIFNQDRMAKGQPPVG